jgi:hypothetical protein
MPAAPLGGAVSEDRRGDSQVLMSQRDAAELASRRAHDVKVAAAYRGWNFLVIWYVFWTGLLVIGSFSALVSGSAGVVLVGLILAGLSGWYSHYLYNGGRRRVWFFFW